MKKNIVRAIVATALATSIAVGVGVSTGTPENSVALPTPVEPISARMLFPLYITPGTNGVNWNPVIAANQYCNIDVIVNPYNGPSTSQNINYVTGIARLKAACVGVYGYVYSTYGARPIADVKADVDKWASWYGPLTGIFVDEAEYRAGQGDEPYYAELYAYIKSKGMRVINNPGTGTNETYLNLADTTCIFESAATKGFTFPSWGWIYPPSKFCYLSFAATIDQMRSAVNMAVRNNIQYVYITNASSNYWSSIPPYFAEEAALLYGGGVMPVTTPSVFPSTTTQTPATAVPTIASVTVTKTQTQPITPTLTPTITRTPTQTATRTATPIPEACFPLVPTVVIDGVGRGQVCFR